MTVRDVLAEEAAAPEAKPAVSLVRLSDVAPKRLEWLWAGFVPLGKIAVVDGDPGLGKSLATLDLAARVTTGAAMPGDRPGALYGKPAGVVLLTAEDDPGDTLRPRLDAAGADVSRVVLLAGVTDQRGERMPNLGDLEAIRTAIASVEARLVVIDPIMAYLGGDAHRDNEVRQSLGPIGKLAAELSVSVVCVRHLNKSGGTSAIYRGGGSIAIVGAARVGMLVAKHPEDDSRRVLAVSKSNLAEIPKSLVYSVEATNDVPRVRWLEETDHSADDLLVVSPSDPDDPTKTEEAANWLRGELASGPRLSEDVKRAARDVGFSWRTVERAKGEIGAEARRMSQGGTRGAGAWAWRMKGDEREIVFDSETEDESRDPENDPRARLEADAAVVLEVMTARPKPATRAAIRAAIRAAGHEMADDRLWAALVALTDRGKVEEAGEGARSTYRVRAADQDRQAIKTATGGLEEYAVIPGDGDQGRQTPECGGLEPEILNGAAE